MIWDFYVAAQWLVTVVVVVAVSAMVVRQAANNYFAEVFSELVPVGAGGSSQVGTPPAPFCVVCGRSGIKICSRCKSVRYCSEACQTKHWHTWHRFKCKPMGSLHLVDASSTVSINQMNRSSGFSSIALVPTRRTCKVLPEPKKILFPYDEFVKLFNWERPGFPPCGLINCGNSCFANVVLQCLASTRPLTAYLLECSHHKECLRKQTEWCFLCELQSHIQRSSESPNPFPPLNIISRLRNIGSNLSCGRQEDAHEFMRYAIDMMQSICLDKYGGEDVVEPSSQDTTLIQYIFGGLLQSQVTCTKCGTVSNRYDKMMDLTVEIQGEVNSLEECLNQFTVKEWLDGDNMYKCEGCNNYVRAWKRLTVHQAPNILTIALKRFESGMFGKLNKRITYPEILNLTPYMTGPGDGTDIYSLYAVVVHLDMLNASFCGHYICYTKDSQNNWYRIDDCKVTRVEVEEVLSQTAYMLLYSRRNPRKDPFVKPLELENKRQLAKLESLSRVPTLADHGSHVAHPAVNVDMQLDQVIQDTPAYVSLPMDTDDEEVSSATMNFVKSQGSESFDSDAADPKASMGAGVENTVDVPSSINSELVWGDLVSVDKIDQEENIETDLSTVEFNDGVIGKGPGYAEDGSSMTAEMANHDMPQKNELDFRFESEHRAICEQTVDLANQVLNVVAEVPSDGMKKSDFFVASEESGRQIKPKPLFSRGFLDVPARNDFPLHRPRSLLQDHVGLSLRVNGYSNGKLEPNHAEDSFQCHNNLISKESPLTPYSSLFSSELVHNSCRMDKDNVLFGEPGRAGPPDSNAVEGAFHFQNSDIADSLGTKCFNGGVHVLEKSNGVHDYFNCTDTGSNGREKTSICPENGQSSSRSCL